MTLRSSPPPPPPPPAELRTERLRLRRWIDRDRAPFAALSADPEVMEHFPAPLSRRASEELADHIDACFDSRGFGLWAIEVAGGPAFAGYVGLWPTEFDAHFTPAVEIGWRLDRSSWGHGYATEGARAALADGFDRVGLNEIVSFTATTNVRSQRVMQRLGMHRRVGEDFDHPLLPVGHRLRRHVLYRLGRGEFTR